MTWRYTKHDRDLCDAAFLELRQSVPGSDGTTVKDGRIEFQFPPKVTSDSRKGTWEEGDLPGAEPVFAFSVSSAREITLTWTYVVDGGEWTIGRITSNIRTLRGYFAEVRNPESDHQKLVVLFRLWAVGGPERISALIKNIDVKYGDTIVTDYNPIRTFSRIDHSFYLRTDVTVDLRIWTRGVGEGADEVLQDIENLIPTAPPEWY
jgi:hypothetical protein